MQTRESGGMGTSKEINARTLFVSNLCAMEVDFPSGYTQLGVTYFGGVSLPCVSVYKDEGFGTRNYLRNIRHIQQAPIDEYMFNLQLRAASTVFQGGTQTIRHPGTSTLMTLSRPFSGFVSSDGSADHFSGLLAKIAGNVFRQHVPDIDDYMTQPLVLSTFTNKTTKFLLELSLADATTLSEGQAQYLSDTLVDAIANATLEAIGKVKPQERQYQSSLARVHEEARDFILRNLSSPALHIEQIANYCGVSERYLQKAFSAYSGPIGEFIREERLQRCRVEILDKRLAAKSVRDIAIDAGFTDLAYFSRAYKLRFGVCPREDRKGS